MTTPTAPLLTNPSDLALYGRGDSPAAWQANGVYPSGVNVTFAGALYACVTGHTSGTVFDQSKWLQLAAGGEIAYGQNITDTSTVGTAGFTTIPGCQVAIPAGCGPYMLEFWGHYSIAATAAAGGAQLEVQFTDELGGSTLFGVWLTRLPSASQSAKQPVFFKIRMPATTIPKTFTVQDVAIVASATVSRSFASNAPGYIQAYAR